MNMVPMPPRPEGELRHQIQQQYAYLFQLAQLLNLSENADGVNGGRGKSPAASDAELRQQYQTTRGMVLKTADDVSRKVTAEVTGPDIRQLKQDTESLKDTNDDVIFPQIGNLQTSVTEAIKSINQLGVKLSSDYVAISDFGSYIEQISAEIEANPAAVTTYYKFFADLKANVDVLSQNLNTVGTDFNEYTVKTSGYIRKGIVYYDNSIPVYGVAVGQNLTATVVDGEEVIDQRDFRATFTAQKLSFWQDEVEVAYISSNQLYINQAVVLREIKLGNWALNGGGGLTIKWIGG